MLQCVQVTDDPMAIVRASVHYRLCDNLGRGEHLTSTSGDRKFCRAAYWCVDCYRNVLFSYYAYKKHPIGVVVIETNVHNFVVIHHS